MIRNCELFITTRLMGVTHRSWVKSKIKALRDLKFKTEKQEHELCSLSHTLIWIPFSSSNEINELCKKCDYYDIHNSYFK